MLLVLNKRKDTFHFCDNVGAWEKWICICGAELESEESNIFSSIDLPSKAIVCKHCERIVDQMYSIMTTGSGRALNDEND